MADIKVIDRGVVRRDLAAFLKERMGTPKMVFPYVPADLMSQAPLTCVTSAPSERIRDTPETYENQFGLSVRNYTIYSLESQPDWTPEMAENMLDTLEWEASIALLQADQEARSHTWRAISRYGKSTMEMVKISGVLYLEEIINVIVEVDDEKQ
jgi:hypothetical protein